MKRLEKKNAASLSNHGGGGVREEEMRRWAEHLQQLPVALR